MSSFIEFYKYIRMNLIWYKLLKYMLEKLAEKFENKDKKNAFKMMKSIK